jgi:transcriptional regulator with XRE-family HTH domain
MNDNKLFANELKTVRKQAGLRQIDVAQMLGHSSADRISHWEKGLAAPGLVNLFKLSLIYGLPPEQLYAGLHTAVAENLKREQSGTPKIEDTGTGLNLDTQDFSS